MASRPELVQIAQELDLEYDDLTMEELTDLIKTTIDEKFIVKYRIGTAGLSTTLLKFMYMECDFVLVDKLGKRYDYKGDAI